MNIAQLRMNHRHYANVRVKRSKCVILCTEGSLDRYNEDL